MTNYTAYKDLDPPVLHVSVGEVGLDDLARRAVDDAVPVDLVLSPLAAVDHTRRFEEAQACPVSEV